jgi:hypothetical protein
VINRMACVGLHGSGAPRACFAAFSEGKRRSRAGWLGSVLLVLVMGLSARPASAQEPAAAGDQSAKLEQAVKHVEQLNYPDARQLLFDVVQSGKATAEQLAQAYFNLGVVEAALDNAVESTDSFYVALMLQPSLLFPEGGSPKIRERLNEARSRVTEVGVLEVRAGVADGVLDVHVDNDPLKLVKRVEVLMTRSEGEVGKAALDKNELRAEVDPGVKSIQVVLRDEVGNQLKVLEVDPAAAKAPTGAQPIEAVTTPSVWSKWGLWAGVAGALALGSTYFIMESSDLAADIDAAEDEPEPDTAEIARLEDNRDRVGLYGVVGFSLAGAAALTAGALLILGGDGAGDDADKGASTEASLVPSLAPGHVGARFSLKF